MFWSIVVTGCEWNWILPVSDLVLNPRSTSWRKSTVYGLNGHRSIFIIDLSLGTYEHAISKSRRFTALFLWTPGTEVS
jgi:hypothetical protein